jgi:hypothetical protein
MFEGTVDSNPDNQSGKSVNPIAFPAVLPKLTPQEAHQKIAEIRSKEQRESSQDAVEGPVKGDCGYLKSSASGKPGVIGLNKLQRDALNINDAKSPYGKIQVECNGIMKEFEVHQGKKGDNAMQSIYINKIDGFPPDGKIVKPQRRS